MAQTNWTENILAWVFLAVLGMAAYGGFAGAKELFSSGDLAAVECHAGGQTVYDGIAKHGLHHAPFGSTYRLEDMDSGQTVEIGQEAVCVVRTLPKDWTQKAATGRR